MSTNQRILRTTRLASLILLFAVACGNLAAPTPIPTETAPEALIAAPAACTAVSSLDRESVLDTLNFPPFGEGDHMRGPQNAQVSFIEYGDFQCPFCAQLHSVLLELENRYPEELRVAFRHFPLIGSEEQPIHPKAALAMQASEAAANQGRFWEMHDLLFERLAEWTNLSDEDFDAWLLAAADELELDTAQFSADLHSQALTTQAQEAWLEGPDLEISTTPTLLINGLPYPGPLDVGSLDAIIQLELLPERQFHECPAFTIDQSLDYTATLYTEKGDIVIQLFPKIAPTAVNSFVFLAENDWFDGVTFHRVLPGFIAQAGDPTGTGYGGPGYSFSIEINSTLSFDRAGLLAMANSGPTANGSQFFITLGPAAHLNGGYTIFGEVLDGLQVVESLAARDPSQEAGLPPGDRILDVSIEAR
ncbi:MAG: peptidylprolyl isomerase [Chloroflexi bacterium]|nr:peptidylprolyl isomerase [Chloroflexota bacterium]